MVEVTKIAIIDHASHSLYVEDVYNHELDKYNSVDEYIRDNYTIKGSFSWGKIRSAEYIGVDDKTPYDIPFDYCN